MNEENCIRIDFTRFPFCFRAVKYKKITNCLKSSKEFCEKIEEVFEKQLYHITQYTFDNVYQNTKGHSHGIHIKTKEYSLVIEIFKMIYKSWKPDSHEDDIEKFIESNTNDYMLWQLGSVGGPRLIGIRINNTFYVLFFDYYHLIYPNKYHNQEDVLSYNFCPITNYIE